MSSPNNGRTKRLATARISMMIMSIAVFLQPSTLFSIVMNEVNEISAPHIKDGIKNEIVLSVPIVSPFLNAPVSIK